jgi:hypothetical protein
VLNEFLVQVPSAPSSNNSSATNSKKEDNATANTTTTTTTTSNQPRKSWFSGITSSIQQISTSIAPNLISASSSSSTLLSSVPGILIDEQKVVLYYCSCLVNNIPGYLYLTARHLFVSSSILGLNQKKEVYSLHFLVEMILLHNSNNSATTPSNNNSANSTADDQLPTTSQKQQKGVVPFEVDETTAPSTTSTTTLKESIQSSATNLINTNAMKMIFSSNEMIQWKPNLNNTNSNTMKPVKVAVPTPISKELLISPLTMDCQKLKTIILEIRSHFTKEKK